VLSADVGIKESVLGGLVRLYVEIKESVLAAAVSRELDADDIKLLDDGADVMRLVLARLRRDDDDVTALPLAATSAAFASSISRSLSSLR